MKPEAQRIAIAEACGWICNNPLHENVGQLSFSRDIEHEPWLEECGWNDLPDYLSDLNAMHEAEKLLTSDELQERFAVRLIAFVCPQDCLTWLTLAKIAHATAAQRCEAFLRAITSTHPAELQHGEQPRKKWSWGDKSPIPSEQLFGARQAALNESIAVDQLRDQNNNLRTQVCDWIDDHEKDCIPKIGFDHLRQIVGYERK